MSSLITYKTDERYNSGEITLYNNSNCTVEDDLKNKCEMQINLFEGYGVSPGGDGETVFHKDTCPDFKGDIKSVSIEGKAGFVIRSSDNYCMYFDVDQNKGNNCINLENTRVFYESGYDPFTGDSIPIRPKEIMVFPISK